MEQITPQVLARQGYGWSSYIRFNKCTSTEAVQRYFQRAGELLCFLYVLREKDCHAENIIAAGEYPVVVDLETLISPCFTISANSNEDYNSYLKIEKSILRTAILFDNNLGSFGESGLGGLPGQDSSLKGSRWYNVNTDRMLRAIENITIPSRENLPYLDNKICYAKNYKNFIKKGFKNAYLFFMENRKFFGQDNGLLARFESPMYSRFVARSSQLYSVILERASQTNLLEFGIDRSIAIESIRKLPLPFTCDDYNRNQILDSECQQLEVLDIPIFYTSTTSKSLKTIKHGEIFDFFEKTGYESVCVELENLSLLDLQKQLTLIDSSLSG
jgi:lantibiotic modifying enzyme